MMRATKRKLFSGIAFTPDLNAVAESEQQDAGPSGARERRDVVTGSVMEEARLVRFVPDPSGGVTPDLARKLPGRGVWVAADRASVDTAVKKNLFARSCRRQLSPSHDLSDQVERLLRRRLLSGLGLAKKAGDLISGFEKVKEALVAGRVAFAIEASDSGPDGRKKIAGLLRALDSPAWRIGLFSGEELSLALGVGNVIHAAFLRSRGAERWSIDVERLAGFCPLCPDDWDL